MASLVQAIKTYVQVNVDFAADGRMRPMSVIWVDGHIFEIDRILDVRPASAARAGGQGDRYTIRMGDNITYLFFEHSVDERSHVLGRWFVEKKVGM